MRKKTQKHRPTPPRKMSTKELCIHLSGVAAFHTEDKTAQSKIYEAIRRLQLLEKAAIEAGILPARKRLQRKSSRLRLGHGAASS